MAIDVRRILVPVDFSDSTPPLLDWAAHLAEQHASSIILLHAYHLPVEFQQLEGAYLPPDFWASVKAEAEESLARLEAELEQRGVEVETVVCEGYAATVIVEEAKARDADLIVIGTHGLSGLKHLLLGSIAERVVQKAPCPVLSVKTGQDA
jgi:nucleotide-binding universal stress UspA family protein